MLAEFVQSIVDLTNASTSFRSHDLPDGKNRIIMTPTGELREVPIPPPRRRWTAGDLDSFVRLLGDVDTDPIVFITQTNSGFDAAAYLCKHNRDETVTLNIAPSGAYTALVELHRCWHDQKTVVQLLRDQLYDAAPAGLIAAMRSLEFGRRNDGSRTIEHGRESLGRSVESEVKAKHGDLPETVQLTLPFFATAPFNEFQYRVHVAIDLDATNEKIRFIPRGDELTQELHRAARNIREVIDDELNGSEQGSAAIPVVIGTP